MKRTRFSPPPAGPAEFPASGVSRTYAYSPSTASAASLSHRSPVQGSVGAQGVTARSAASMQLGTSTAHGVASRSTPPARLTVTDQAADVRPPPSAGQDPSLSREVQGFQASAQPVLAELRSMQAAVAQGRHIPAQSLHHRIFQQLHTLQRQAGMPLTPLHLPPPPPLLHRVLPRLTALLHPASALWRRGSAQAARHRAWHHWPSSKHYQQLWRALLHPRPARQRQHHPMPLVARGPVPHTHKPTELMEQRRHWCTQGRHHTSQAPQTHRRAGNPPATPCLRLLVLPRHGLTCRHGVSVRARE